LGFKALAEYRHRDVMTSYGTVIGGGAAIGPRAWIRVPCGEYAAKTKRRGCMTAGGASMTGQPCADANCTENWRPIR
jgi:hypothetical protein